MQYRAYIPILALFATTCLSNPASAGDCAFLNRDPLELRDRQVFYKIKGDPVWASLDGARVDLVNASVEYTYVVRETIDAARSGVVVLKSARSRQLDEPGGGRKVRLVREPESRGDISCGPAPSFPETDISAKSYDDFHDRGSSVPESRTLRAFHVRYAARLNRCRRTDDNNPDSILPRDARSNLGQFSFNQDVVARETYSQAIALVGTSTADATPDVLSDQRVEIRKYNVSANFPTCVRFTIPPAGRAAFLRINDLEGLTRSVTGNGYVRSQESTWSLSR